MADDPGIGRTRPSALEINPLQLFDIAKQEERPLYAAAPMVRYSKLAFRETVAQYGVDLCWTPMMLAKEFNRSILARDSEPEEGWYEEDSITKISPVIGEPDFTTSPTSPPTIAQFGCNSPLELSKATILIAPHVNGIDINCGCPQSWACAETLGAALMHKRELVASMITAAKEAIKSEGFEGQKTVSVKIRVHKDLRETVDFIKTVEAAGADFLTIHGRTRSTPSSLPVNLDAITLLNSHTHVPTLSNGDIFTLRDAESHTRRTGVDGVMSARGLLENPALFAGYERCPWEAVELFMSMVIRRPLPFGLVLHHVSEMVGSDRSQRGKTLLLKEERVRLLECKSMLELIDFLDSIRELMRL